MRNKLGTVCMLLGAALLCGALWLYCRNQQEDRQAEVNSQAVLPQILEQIPEQPHQDVLAERLPPLEFRDPETFEMTEVEIDGYGYIGYLSIPALDRTLPIMGSWDYERLKIAPCRYYGSVNSDDLVLMGHNYKVHFGPISRLKSGDAVVFTDMDGVTTYYHVVSRDVLPPDAVEEMTAGDFDLTLFTCTYGGESRVTVYCDKD